MSTQIEMFPLPKEDVNVAYLANRLRERGGWATSVDLLNDLGLPDTENHRRWIRRLAEQADPDVISGQLGYKHVANATQDEIHHFVAWMESQGKKMIARAESVRRRAHQILR